FFGATDPAVQALGVPGPAQPDKKDWAPRVGFAYSPGGRFFGGGKTVLRGGFGMNYDVLFYNILSVNSQNYPRVANTQVTSPATFNTYPTLPPKQGAAVLNPLNSWVNSPSD